VCVCVSKCECGRVNVCQFNVCMCVYACVYVYVCFYVFVCYCVSMCVFMLFGESMNVRMCIMYLCMYLCVYI